MALGAKPQDPGRGTCWQLLALLGPEVPVGSLNRSVLGVVQTQGLQLSTP